MAIAPVRKTPFGRNNGEDAIDEGLSMFLAASSFLHARNDIARISVVGFGEGGLIALWALARMPDPAKGVVLSPSRLTQGEKRADTMNLDAFLKREEAKSIQAPLLLTVGDLESRRSKRTASQISEALMKAHRQFRFIRNYPARQRLFHQRHNASWMTC